MTEYLKLLGFTLVVFYSVYDVICEAPVQRNPLPFTSGGHASLSFISGEAGPPKPAPARGGFRDFVAPQPPQSMPYNPQNIPKTPNAPGNTPGSQNTGTQGGNKPGQNIPSAPGNTNTRDYVAPKPLTPQNPGTQGGNKPGQNIPSAPGNTQINPGSQNTRDYVAPKPLAPQNPGSQGGNKPGQNIPNAPGYSQINPGSQNTRDFVAPKPLSPGRDFVNPNFNPNQGQKEPFPALNPPRSQPSPTGQNIGGIQQNSGRRDFVNPNFKPGQSFPALNPSRGASSGPQTQNSGSRDFVNPNLQKPKEDFPALKPTGGINTGPKPGQNPARDFVNPNFPSQKPKDPFPALKPSVPNRGVPQGSVVPSIGSRSQVLGSVISYAQKASGGVTTPRPQVSGGSNSGTAPVDLEGKAVEDGPKDNELRDFSEELLKKDVNNAYKYVKLNVQGKTTSQSKNDEAPQNLLEVSKEAFNIPTIAKLRLFYNNYILEVSENEFVTLQEKNEENDLLDTMISTPIMQHTKNFLVAKGKISKDPKDFKDLLRTIWFSMYSRGQGRVGSSGFEHIFLAELKKDKNEVSGLHNWLYFHEAEQTNLANYLGYMKKIDLGEKGAILKFHFTLSGTDKPVNSIFVGTSPELEMALYTTCYIFRANRVCPLRLAGNNFIIRAYSLKYRGKQLIGSAFPEI